MLATPKHREQSKTELGIRNSEIVVIGQENVASFHICDLALGGIEMNNQRQEQLRSANWT